MFSLILTHFTTVKAIIIHKWILVFLLKMLRDGRLQQGVDGITESYYKAMVEMRDIIQIIPKQDFRSILIQNLIMAKVFKSAKLKEICFSFDK